MPASAYILLYEPPILNVKVAIKEVIAGDTLLLLCALSASFSPWRCFSHIRMIDDQNHALIAEIAYPRHNKGLASGIKRGHCLVYEKDLRAALVKENLVHWFRTEHG